MITKLINLTPHDINIHLTDVNDIAFNCSSEWINLPPSGIVARCKTDFKTMDILNVDNNYMEETASINIRERFFNKPTDLPPPQDGVLYIVSRIVAEAMANVRTDLLMVDETIRDGKEIIGCEALARWPVDKEEYDCGCVNHGDDESVMCETCGYASCLDCHQVNATSSNVSEWKCYEGYGCNKYYPRQEKNRETWWGKDAARILEFIEQQQGNMSAFEVLEDVMCGSYVDTFEDEEGDAQ